MSPYSCEYLTSLRYLRPFSATALSKPLSLMPTLQSLGSLNNYRWSSSSKSLIRSSICSSKSFPSLGRIILLITLKRRQRFYIINAWSIPTVNGSSSSHLKCKSSTCGNSSMRNFFSFWTLNSFLYRASSSLSSGFSFLTLSSEGSTPTILLYSSITLSDSIDRKFTNFSIFYSP